MVKGLHAGGWIRPTSKLGRGPNDVDNPDRSQEPEPDWTHDTVIMRMPDGKWGVPIPVSVWLTHSDFVGPLIDKLRPLVVVEVGVFTGASLLCMRAWARYYRTNTQFFGIDDWTGRQSGTTGWIWDGEEVYQKLCQRTRKYGNIHLLRMESAEGVKAIPDSSVDLLHIDGDHREEGVRRDLELWLPKVALFGVVLLHDIGMVTDDCQVWKVWYELMGRYPTYSDTRAAGLGAFCPRGVNPNLRYLFKQAIIV